MSTSLRARSLGLLQWFSSEPGRRSVWLVCWLLVIQFVYVVIVSAGHFTTWPPQMRFHDLQAEAFRHAQSHLLLSPRPELLSAANPYDPRFSRFWVFDLSFYEGRYYLYWGPVPAALLAAAKTLLRVAKPVGDSVLAFGFFSFHAVVGAVLIQRLARRTFPTLPAGFVGLAVFTFALAAPTLHGIASGSVYVASISGGQAFSWLGIALCLELVFAAPRPRPLLAWLAGTSFALALGCRVSLAPSMACIGLVAALFVALPKLSFASFCRALVPIAAPCTAALAGLLLYNRLRFDRFLEFGTGVQLSAWKFRASLDYLAANLHSYAFRTWEFGCSFPYLRQGRGIPQNPPWDWLGVPADYATVSPMVGVLVALPVVWAAPAALLPLLARLRRGVGALTRRLREPGAIRARVLLFAGTTFTLAASVTGFPELGLNVATMRYTTDVSSGLVLLGLLGTWVLLARVDPRAPLLPRVAVRSLAVGLPAATIVTGLLLGYQGYDHHFQTHNPTLHGRLSSALSFCAPGTSPGQTTETSRPSRRAPTPRAARTSERRTQ